VEGGRIASVISPSKTPRANDVPSFHVMHIVVHVIIHTHIGESGAQLEHRSLDQHGERARVRPDGPCLGAMVRMVCE